MNLSPEERAIGKENFNAAIGSELTRREFLERSIAAAAVTGVGLGGFYFGYEKLKGDPVRVGMIGTGDEGGVLIGAHTPDYLNIVAISDIRPYNVHRAFHGDQSSESIRAVRPGLMAKYGWKSEDEAKSKVKVYTDYQDLLKDDQIEAVIIALPLFLHDVVAIEAMNHGKHVLTEKLMAHSVHQCKNMARVSHQKRLHLATGHQRHYSILYDNAVDTIKRGLIGDIHFIRAQWHRGNLPGKDSWAPPLPDKKMEADLAKVVAEIESLGGDASAEVKKFTDLLKVTKELESARGSRIDALEKRRELLTQQLLDKDVDAAKYGYEAKTLTDGGSKAYECSPLEELIHWRLWNRTGGGLMAELGSHQLDASGIFCTAMRNDGHKALPLSVTAVGGRYIFPLDRDCDDHVYCTYEYPGPKYDEDPNKKIVVTYSSINGNGFGGYGETVMGTKGTLILDKEQEVMLFKDAATTTSVLVTKGKDGAPTLDTTASGSPAAAAAKKALDAGPPSRGYTEEMEHFAWCIRNFDFENNKPKCHPKVAMADAIIALTTNIAMRENRRIEFKPEWFDIDSDETPEGVKPSVSV
ncbi:MAG TPA: Gfo/Idh/MocA family oxidoreductase [Pirellulales bacterium]|nr:Gfo/Idh/MocA family oxidoreductase [Pirellulales bacterium]